MIYLFFASPVSGRGQCLGVWSPAAVVFLINFQNILDNFANI